MAAQVYGHPARDLLLSQPSVSNQVAALERELGTRLLDRRPGGLELTPAAKLLLARHSRHFAWHAELWDGLVPVLHDRPEGSAVVDTRTTWPTGTRPSSASAAA